MPTIGSVDTAKDTAKVGPHDCSLYVHIPFCTSKCPYCHFYVIPFEEHREQAFLLGIEQEWQSRRALLAGKRIVSIYLGGGTPSLLSASSVGRILDLFLQDRGLSIDSGCEITLEANPESVSLEKMRALSLLGVNRLSIGVQSLDDDQLTLLDRRHLAARAIKAIEESQAAGIDNLSIDLMYDIPGQSLDSWKRTITRAMALPVSHLSLYNLTFEPQTLFFKNRKQLRPLLPSPEDSFEMLQYAITYLEAAGLQRYEISAFARKERYSRHNTGYWTGRPFLGLGPSAFSYFQGKRFKNISSFTHWASSLSEGKSPVDFEERLEPEPSFRELLAIQLRLLEGVDWTAFTTRHGPAPEPTPAILDQLCRDGLLARQAGSLRLTEKGRLFYDSVAEAII